MQTLTPSPMSPVLLDVQGLRTWFHTRRGVVRAVDGVSLQLKQGEILGLVGESGSGKTVTGFSLMTLRGKDIAMVFQDPMMTLNPTLRVDTQMIETVQAHAKVSRAAARARSLEMLLKVGIPAPEERLRAYPHHLSGGMRQRVAIAIALLNSPKLIIADEPTTALDVTIQGQILYEVQKLCRETGTALIWITHDLAIVSGLANRLAVMYAGRIVETGPTADIVRAAQHPYTHGLMASIPTFDTRGRRLFQIPGATPSPLAKPEGCPFRTRCYRATPQCTAEPSFAQTAPGQGVSCWHPGVQTWA
jgi:peptide/nickel transport system ATP-binding protein